MQAKLTYVTPEGNIVPFTIDETTSIADLGNLMAMVLVADETAKAKGLKIMGRKLQAAGENAVIPDQPAAGRASGLSMHCVSMDILPKPGGVVNIELFGDNYKQPRNDYATLYLNTSGDRWTVEKLIELFKPYHTFLPQTFTQAGTFNVDFTVEYHESKKTNTKGNPYLDVDRITVAEGAKKASRGEAPAPPPPVEEPPDIPF
jgi:hypothetical protein